MLSSNKEKGQMSESLYVCFARPYRTPEAAATRAVWQDPCQSTNHVALLTARNKSGLPGVPCDTSGTAVGSQFAV